MRSWIRRLVGAAFRVVLLSIPLLSHAWGDAQIRSGWPATVGHSDLFSIVEAEVQIVDLYGDGSRRVVSSKSGACIDGANCSGLGVVTILRPDGIVESTLPVPNHGHHQIPTFIDVDDDGAYELVLIGVGAIYVFRPNGSVVWGHEQDLGDPDYQQFAPLLNSIAELDGDGEPWVITLAGARECQNCPVSKRIYAWNRIGLLRPGFPQLVPPQTFPGGLLGPNDTYAPPSIIDIDGDDKPEILFGNTYGDIFCYGRSGQPCAGYPVRLWDQATSLSQNFAFSPPAAVDSPTLGRRLVVPDTRRKELYSMSTSCEIAPPFPVALPNWIGYGGLAIGEIDGSAWAFVPGFQQQSLLSVEDGSSYLGWPVTLPTPQGHSRPAIGNIGSASGLAFVLSGPGVINGQYNDGKTYISALDLTGEVVAGFPFEIDEELFPWAIALDTLDGVHTTICGTAGSFEDGFTEVLCIDTDQPWDRGNVHWGNYAFDLQHTSRWRRLYQIDRARSCLSVPATEVPSEPGTPIEVTVCPIGKNGLPLGPDQSIRFARNPVFGKFSGPVRYDPSSGSYSRSYLPPGGPDGASVEFKVFVNEELHSEKPILRVRGRPRIDRVTPSALPIRTQASTVSLTGAEFDRVARVESPTPGLSVASWNSAGFASMTVELRTLAGVVPGWAKLRAIGIDGRASNEADVFLYLPGETTILGKKTSTGAGEFEWFGGNPSGPVTWRLERSGSPQFPASATTTVYIGSLNRATDPTPAPASAPGVFFYRVLTD